MPREKSITFALSAVGDLEDIKAWYEEQQALEVGKRLIEEIVKKIERLIDFPESGRVVPEFSMAALREVIHPPFRIVHRLDGNKITIIRIWRSERLLKMPK